MGLFPLKAEEKERKRGKERERERKLIACERRKVELPKSNGNKTAGFIKEPQPSIGLEVCQVSRRLLIDTST